MRAKDTTTTRALMNLLLESELLAIAGALREANIRCTVLKGIPLTHRLYQHIDARTMSDVDLLVEPHRVNEAHQVLTNLGFKPWTTVPLTTARRLSNTHGYERSSHGVTIYVDLHWTAFPVTLPMPLELQWQHTEPFELQNQQLTVFDPAMTILHLTAHLAKDGFLNGQTLTDLARAWARWSSSLDWAQFSQLREAGQLSRALNHGLASAAALGLLSVPNTSRRTLLQWVMPQPLVEARLQGQMPPQATLIYRQALSRYLVGDLSAGGRHLMRQLLPPRAILEDLVGPRATWQLPGAYLRRALHPVLGRSSERVNP